MKENYVKEKQYMRIFEPDETRPTGRHRLKWEDNIKIYFEDNMFWNLSSGGLAVQYGEYGNKTWGSIIFGDVIDEMEQFAGSLDRYWVKAGKYSSRLYSVNILKPTGFVMHQQV